MRELKRRLANLAMSSKPVDLAQWTLPTSEETEWMILTLKELPCGDTAIPSPHVHRFDLLFSCFITTRIYSDF